jgi:hypothetical protein
MEATLKAENEELLQRKAELQSAIKHEAELIDEYKVELRKYPSRSRRVPTPDSNGESVSHNTHEKTVSWWGQTSQRSLDSGCFELVSSHQQGIRIPCLAHHPALYTQGESECLLF